MAITNRVFQKVLMNDTNIPVVYRYKYYYCTYDVFNSCFSFYMRHQFITEMQLSKAGTYMFPRSENQISSILIGNIFTCQNQTLI